MTNPKEQAIEVLANVLKTTLKQNYFVIHDNDKNAYSAILKGVEAILDALNIEIVSKESEPQKGDLTVRGEKDVYDYICIEMEAGYPQLVNREIGARPRNAYNGNWGIIEIVKRNNKPAVYVENIGGEVMNDYVILRDGYSEGLARKVRAFMPDYEPIGGVSTFTDARGSTDFIQAMIKRIENDRK